MKKIIIIWVMAMILIVLPVIADDLGELYDVQNPFVEFDNTTGKVIWAYNSDDFPDGSTANWVINSGLTNGNAFVVPCADLPDYNHDYNSANCTGNITLLNSTGNFHIMQQPGIALGNNITLYVKMAINHSVGTMALQGGFVEGEDTTKATGYGGYGLGTILRLWKGNSWTASSKALFTTNRYTILKVGKNTTNTITQYDGDSGEYVHSSVSADAENNIYFRFDDIASGHNQFIGIKWMVVCKGECELFVAPPVVESGSLDLLFANETLIYKTSFDEGEDFHTYINFTNSTGIPITDLNASCNISFINGLDEVEGNQASRSICNSGCTIATSETTEVDFVYTLNAVNDSIRFKACHAQTASGNIIATIQCGILSESKTITPMGLPLCTSGNAQIVFENDACIGSSKVNFTISANVPNSQRKTISEIDFDREYSIHTINAVYNSTLEFWQTNHRHEYYKHGNKSISANCSSSNPQFNNSITEIITIVNIPPSIIFSGVTTALGFTSSTAPMIIEYASGAWNWSGSVSDDDLVSFNVSWYNSSRGLIANYTEQVSPVVLSTADELFRDFTNPYSINVSAIDSNGNTTFLNQNFNVTDTTNPVCSGLGNIKVTDLSKNHTQTITCSDESFFSFNVSCPTLSYEYAVTGMNNQTFTADLVFPTTNLSLLPATCSYKFADGHTATELKDDWDVIIKDKQENPEFEFVVNNIPVGKFWLESEEAKLSYDIKKDRVEFNVDLVSKISNYHTFYYQASESSYYFDSEKYSAWIVDASSDTWFDLNGIDGEFTIIYRGNGLWQIDVFTADKLLSFKSIGELNVVTGSFTISSAYGDDWGNYNPFTCPFEQDLASVFGFVALIVLVLFLAIFNFVFLKYPIMTGFVGFGFIILSMSIWACSQLIGLVFVAFGILMMLKALQDVM